MFHGHLASKLVAAHASKDSWPRVDGCAHQWRWAARRSGDEGGGGGNRGSTTVANAAFSGTSSTYVDDMYRLWLNDKTSVHSSWDRYFSANPTSTTQLQSAGASSSVSQLDRKRLVQYVQPKGSASASQAPTSATVSVAENERPIVITIDIVNDSTGSALTSDLDASIKSGDSDSLRSNQTVKSGDGVRSVWKQVGTVEDVPQSGHPPINTTPAGLLPSNVQTPPPPKPPERPPPRPVHPPQGPRKRDVSIPEIKMPPRSVDWQTHVREFKRVYHQPTGGETQLPTFRPNSKMVVPHGSITDKPVVPSRPVTPPVSQTSNKTGSSNSTPVKPTPGNPVPKAEVASTSQKPPTQVAPASSQTIKPGNQQPASANQATTPPTSQTPPRPVTPPNTQTMNKTGSINTTSVQPKPPATPLPSTPPSSQTNIKAGSKEPSSAAQGPMPSKPWTPPSPGQAPTSQKPPTPVTLPSPQNNKTANLNTTSANPKPVTAVQGTNLVPPPSPAETPTQKPATQVTPSSSQTNIKSESVQTKPTHPPQATQGNRPVGNKESTTAVLPSPPKLTPPQGTQSPQAASNKPPATIPGLPAISAANQSSNAPSQPQNTSPPIARKSSPGSGAGSSSSPKIHAAAAAGGGGGGNDKVILQHLAVQGVIRSYQARGHLEARLDPLGILDKDKTTLEQRKGLPTANIIRQHKEFSSIDLATPFHLPETTFIGHGQSTLPLGEIIKRLEESYSSHIGAEFMYIQDMERTLWIRQHLESPELLKLDTATRLKTLLRLIRAVQFESFLAKKYTAEKRFGLEGCDALIPCIKEIIDTSTTMGVEGVNIAMPHRGRLNCLANVCRKSLKDIFTTFAGLASADEGSGDVKYHLGTVITRENSTNKKKVRIAVVANPSHLEAVGPVCLGKTRAEQFMKGDKTGATILGLYVHGDAAFCGQGVVYESMHLSHLPCYTTRGAIHIVINNQVGFTTDPRFSRSSPYCTDVGRVVLAPIFHVNADDPDAVVRIARIAATWRQTFFEDVVIDLVSYRRNGHNEMDEPMFTQPLMYQIIRKHPNVAKIYGDQLIKEGLIQQTEIDNYTKEYLQICEQDFANAKNEKEIRYRDWLDSPWKGFFKEGAKFTAYPDTGIPEETLQHIGKIFSSPPPGDFAIHRGIQRILKNRAKMVAERTTDWSLGEAFAYGSLMKDGYHVRLSGQDVERGTFSHRHHVMHHQTVDMKTFNILANLYPDQAPYTVCNSSLSEYGVLSFEMGYAQVSPYALVMWEGQFGDFANTAQTVIDTYLCSGQSKWFRQCGLVMQLPHGMEGAGPEHSSARLERYLQLCDDDPRMKGPFDEQFILYEHEHCNWFVANCTTPASLFHILRRQMLLPFRKPLVIMTPKSGLRHPRAMSSFDDFLPGKQFQRLIPEAGPAAQAPDQVKKLIFCTGKTYFDLMEWISEAKVEAQIAVARAEQMSPFPYDLVAAEIAKYKNAKVVAWAQEEHMNQGAWLYMHERINGAADGRIVCQYHGRPGACAAATGNKQLHLSEIANYKAQVLNI